MPDQRRRVFNGRYELLGQLARGGMAEVYLAYDHRLGRHVAIKVLFPELSVDATFVERFRREAQAAANLSHPNIVAIFDWGEERSTYFIVMEYVEGQSLSQLIRSEGPFLADRAAGIAIEVAAALGFAHRNGVVHRDVKPGNVLITAAGHVKVTDFGIARAANTSENLTQTGAVMGTATYFSPEQAQGLAVDARSDVYSLGVVLYEMVAGRPPFTGEGPMAVAYKHVNEAPLSPRQLVPALPGSFEAIVLQALAKNAADRYATAEDLRTDLLRFRQGRPISARPPSAAVAGAAAGRHAPGRSEAAGPGAAPGAGAAGAGAAALAAGAAGAAAVGGRGGRRAQKAAAGAGSAGPAGAAGAAGAAIADPTLVQGGSSATTVVETTSGPVRPPSNTWVYAVLLVALLAALVVVLVLLGRSAGFLGTSTKAKTGSVVIPGDLVGKTFADASAELTSLHLTGREIDVANSVKAGVVFKVSPDVGATVPSGSTVELDVSTGIQAAAFVTVPDVVGHTYNEAGQTLVAAGFNVAQPKLQNSDQPYGTVLSQDPAANAEAHQGDTVTLTVSGGQAPSAVPDVTGMPQATAVGDVRAAGFSTVVQREPSSSVPAGTATRTDPPAGTQAAKGSTVTVFVSSGPSSATVPSVVGMSGSNAAAALQAKGFAVNSTTVTVTDPTQDGLVQSQSPSGGSQAPQGATVTIRVGRFG